jgi:chromosome segregation ATPase
MQENAALLRKEEYVLRTLSRNGQGTISNIEAVADRAVRQRDELRAENQELRAIIRRLESGITDLQGEIARIQGKLERAKGDRIEIAQSRRRWIARMWALAGRLPGELRKKDAEIDNIREKLVDMHARLAQEQSTLREVQGQLDEERKNRVGVETELKVAKSAHAQEIRERDLAGQRLKDQLKHVVLSLETGAISI